MNNHKTHTVCVVGAPADVVARINALLDEQRTHLEARWRPGDHAHADLLVIDADSVYGHMDWLKATSSGRVIAAYTKSPESYEAYFSLPEPVTAAGLVAMLNRVGARLDGSTAHAAASPAPGGAKAPEKGASPTPFRTSAEAVAKVAAARAASAPAAPTANVEARPVAPAPVVAQAPAPAPTPAPAIASTPPAAPIAPSRATSHPTHPSIHLLDLLEVDAPLKGRLRLAAEGLPVVLLDPRERMWHSASTLKGLSAWSTRALNVDDVHHVEEREFQKEISTMQAHPYARLQWLAHLILGEGQLEPGLDVNARYKLSRWPQSEREFPKHFRIATMMLKQAGTVAEVSEQCGATPADVANFINAYHALGFIEQENADNSGRSGGIFGRMRKTTANIS